MPKKRQIDYGTADLTSIVIGLHEAKTCREVENYIVRGREILRYLKRKKRMPSENTMARWTRYQKSFKKNCSKKA